MLLGRTTAAAPEINATTGVPDALTANAALHVSGLIAGTTYLLRLDVGGSIAGASSTLLGLSSHPDRLYVPGCSGDQQGRLVADQSSVRIRAAIQGHVAELTTRLKRPFARRTEGADCGT